MMNYLQKLFCQMALVKKTVQDFNEVFAPKSTTVEQDDYEEDETNLER